MLQSMNPYDWLRLPLSHKFVTFITMFFLVQNFDSIGYRPTRPNLIIRGISALVAFLQIYSYLARPNRRRPARTRIVNFRQVPCRRS